MLMLSVERLIRTPDTDVLVSAALRRPNDDQSVVYNQALALLTSAQASPSCYRVATSGLLDSCHSIDGTKPDAELRLDDVRSVYAAKLAICEIAKANSDIPQSCQFHVKSASHDTKEGGTGISRLALDKCLRALESRPQWWTSYSNSRQNAVILCRAARTDIEKGLIFLGMQLM